MYYQIVKTNSSQPKVITDQILKVNKDPLILIICYYFVEIIFSIWYKLKIQECSHKYSSR